MIRVTPNGLLDAGDRVGEIDGNSDGWLEGQVDMDGEFEGRKLGARLEEGLLDGCPLAEG